MTTRDSDFTLESIVEMPAIHSLGTIKCPLQLRIVIMTHLFETVRITKMRVGGLTCVRIQI